MVLLTDNREQIDSASPTPKAQEQNFNDEMANVDADFVRKQAPPESVGLSAGSSRSVLDEVSIAPSKREEDLQDAPIVAAAPTSQFDVQQSPPDDAIEADEPAPAAMDAVESGSMAARSRVDELTDMNMDRVNTGALASPDRLYPAEYVWRAGIAALIKAERPAELIDRERAKLLAVYPADVAESEIETKDAAVSVDLPLPEVWAAGITKLREEQDFARAEVEIEKFRAMYAEQADELLR